MKLSELENLIDKFPNIGKDKSLVISDEVILSILKKEIPKLFSELAHKTFDFENMRIERFTDNLPEQWTDVFINNLRVVVPNKQE
jgi:hypothetical protein